MVLQFSSLFLQTPRLPLCLQSAHFLHLVSSLLQSLVGPIASQLTEYNIFFFQKNLRDHPKRYTNLLIRFCLFAE
ncbi:hypothetical protein CW304_19295 [Bacillus sp. UFRGS-B20]|nr:hypothetical protein CW304_19295 [Bacillus sp. UFRGS-B20]